MQGTLLPERTLYNLKYGWVPGSYPACRLGLRVEKINGQLRKNNSCVGQVKISIGGSSTIRFRKLAEAKNM
jgi:hypothetical protein